MSVRWLQRIARRFVAARSHPLPATRAGNPSRPARPRLALGAVLTLPAAALWFATLAVLAGDPVDYVSPDSASSGGGGTQLIEQRLRGATGTPAAVGSSGSQPQAAPSPSPAGPQAAPSPAVAPGVVVGAPTAAAPSVAPSPSAAQPTLPVIVPPRSASPAPATPPPSPPPTSSPSLQPTSPPSIEPTPTPTPGATPAAARLGDCADGIDNDGDGLVDLLDPGCLLGLLDDEAALV